MQKQIMVGWATTSITPDRPVYVYGQLYYRILSYVHDPITATALVLDNGDDQAIFLSADMPGIYLPICNEVRKQLKGFDGIDPSKITFSATHTHNSCAFVGDRRRDGISLIVGEDCLPEMDIPDNLLTGDEAFDFIVDKFVTVIKDAWAARAPGGVSYAPDYAAIGFNRRPVFDLGGGKIESKMYGVCSQDNFIRFEGTVDHTIDMLYTWDLDRNLTGVMVDVPAPSQVCELHCFLSADYWGYARSAIRDRLGNIFVLSICGAAGDQNPLDLVRISKDNVKELKAWNAQAGEVFRNFDMSAECEDIAERIADAVDRGYRKAQKNIQTRPVLRHTVIEISLPIRKVTEDDYKEADATVKAIASEFTPKKRMTGTDLVRMFEPLGIVNRWELQQKTDTYEFSSSILRIGEVAVCTCPFELFVEYAMRVRARCKARQTFVVQLANDVGGYLPTDAAIAGGSYSSKPASTTIGPRGGDKLAETFISEIDKLWK